jgi:molybdopterin-containing oxidoreductase family membrane subunit
MNDGDGDDGDDDGAAARDAALTDRVLGLLRARPRGATLLLLLSGAGSGVFFVAAAYTVVTGIGVWGNNIPVAWGFGITDFVWWIGIGHAGTFISAVLLLLRQRWRTSISRIAESMTLFAVANAGLFPILHLGRAWFAYWVAPYPSPTLTWPQFRSPLTWDIGAISTYLIVSLLLWSLGLVPDWASARDHAVGRGRRRLYGLLALGWRGTRRQWRALASAQLLLAGLATPLVVSVHSIVALDFATARLHGWHSTIFPVYFVAGALFSGFAMLLTVLVPVRAVWRLDDLITTRHLDAIARSMLALSLFLAYSYAVEHYSAAVFGSDDERRFFFVERPTGPAGVVFWLTLFGNVLVPQLLWWPAVRRSPLLLLAIALVVNAAMWLERYLIVVGSLARDALPSSFGSFLPSLTDAVLLGGSVCFFVFLLLLLLRFVPFLPLSELRGEARHG